MANAFDSVRDGEPRDLVAGDLWTWTRDDLAADYPPASYTLKYEAVQRAATPATISITAIASGGSFLVEESATGTHTPGDYDWAALIERQSDGARLRVDSGLWTVHANPTAGVDPRSYQERLLAAVEAVLEGKAAKDVASYSIEGRSLTKIPIPELLELRNRLRREVAAEARRQAGGGKLKAHKVSFF